MDLGLSGRVAVITGASRGIGRAIAEELSAEGMSVVVAARSASDLLDLARSVSTPALVHAGDLSRPEAAGALVGAAVEVFGRVDLVVNNAGATVRGDFLALSEDQWQDGFSLKFFAAVRLCRAAWPHLVAERGAIVNIAGIGGRTGSAEFTIGGSVNAAMLNLTKALADRGVRDGVRVNAVNPGSIATDRLARRVAQVTADEGISRDEAVLRMTRALGIARFGEPRDVAATVAFLASSRSSYLNGAVIDVDGGATRTL